MTLQIVFLAEFFKMLGFGKSADDKKACKLPCMQRFNADLYNGLSATCTLSYTIGDHDLGAWTLCIVLWCMISL